MLKAVSCSVFLVFAGAALTQQILAQQKGAPADFAGTIKNQYNQNKGYILASADKWPEDAYAWRPTGLEAELRTFGQMLVHIANENNQQCSRVSGQPGPPAADDSKAVYTKAAATKILKDSFALCDPVFNALTDQSIVEPIQMGGRGQRSRGTQLIADLTHSNEQYGMIMVYFAIRGMVPVSHAK